MTLQSSARASHCGGFSCRGARAPRCTGPAAAVPGLLAPRHVGSSRPGTRPVFPASAAGLFTTEWPGQPLWIHFRWNCLQHQSFSGGWVQFIYFFLLLLVLLVSYLRIHCVFVQSLSHIWLFETPWTAARRAYLASTISCSLLKLRIHLPTTESHKDLLLVFFFFFGCCIPLALIFRSVMRFELIFACGGR